MTRTGVHPFDLDVIEFRYRGVVAAVLCSERSHPLRLAGSAAFDELLSEYSWYSFRSVPVDVAELMN